MVVNISVPSFKEETEEVIEGEELLEATESNEEKEEE